MSDSDSGSAIDLGDFVVVEAPADNVACGNEADGVESSGFKELRAATIRAVMAAASGAVRAAPGAATAAATGAWAWAGLAVSAAKQACGAANSAGGAAFALTSRLKSIAKVGSADPLEMPPAVCREYFAARYMAGGSSAVLGEIATAVERVRRVSGALASAGQTEEAAAVLRRYGEVHARLIREVVVPLQQIGSHEAGVDEAGAQELYARACAPL